MKSFLKKHLPDFYPHNLITKLRLFFFQCSLNLRTQLIWEIFRIHMQILYKKPNHIKSNKEIMKIIQSIKKNGFGILGKTSLDLSELNEHIECAFRREPSNQYNLYPRVLDSLTASYIYKILCEFTDHIEAYFNSNFQTYWISIYKTYPGRALQDSSFAWHQDEDPRAVHKIFIYLNDVNRNNGALRTFDRITSKKLFGMGFISNSPESRINSQKIVNESFEKKSHWIEGEAGTVLIFDNNLVHKGTFPEKGFRTVIAIEIFPSRKKISLKDIEKSMIMPMIDDWPKNPYLWNPST